MRIKIKSRLIERKTLIFSGISLLFLSVLFFFYFQFANVEKVYAATNFHTLADGEWSSSIWSNTSPGGSNCTCNPGGNFNKVAYISKNITVSTYSPFKFSGGGVVNIVGNGRLTFNCNVELSGGSLMTIDSLDTVTVNGNLLVSSSDIDVKGFFKVNGNATLTGGSTVCGTGFALLNGTLSGTTWCGGIVLPIKLLNFNVRKDDDGVKLNWSTATETNNDYFTVQRSKDGVNFEDIFNIKGSGNSTSIIQYSAVDKFLSNDIAYYRLKQTDYDGKYDYSKIKTINFKKADHKNKLSIQSIGPNPFDEEIKIEFSVPVKETVNIVISKFTGQVVYQENVDANEGLNVFSLNKFQHFSPGTYIIRVVGNDEAVTKKIIKS